MNIDTTPIITLEKELLLAMKNANLEKLNELLHDDLLFNIPTGETITKAIDLANYRSGAMNITEIFSDQQQINIIDTTAVVATTINMKGSFLEHKLDGSYRFIRVWIQTGSTWKIIAGSSTAL